MWVKVVKLVAPQLLLFAAICRTTFPSLVYLGLFVFYFLYPPIKQSGRNGRWEINWGYWVALICFTAFVCACHLVFQLACYVGKTTPSSTARLFSMVSITNASDALQFIFPDVVAAAGSIICTAILAKLQRETVPAVSSSYNFFLSLFLGLSMLLAGISSTALLNLPYFLVFACYLCLRSLYGPLSQHFPMISERVASLGLIYIIVHLLTLYLVQFDAITALCDADMLETLGLYVPTTFDSITFSHVQGTGAQIILFMLMNQHQIRSINDAQSEESQSLLRSDRSHLSSSSPAARVSTTTAATGPRRKSRGSAGLGVVISHKGQEVQQRVLRFLRLHGRFLCHAIMLACAFTFPSFISLGTLFLVCVSMVLMDESFTRFTPLMLVYIIVTSTFQYLFSIPHLLPSSSTLRMIGLARYDIAFVYLLDSFIPAFVLAGYVGLVQHSEEAEITEETLVTAAATGDWHMISRAIDRVPELVSNIETKDIQRRSLLHLAAKNGHRRTVKMLYHLISVNRTDARGNTPLHLASQEGYVEVVDALRERPEIDIGIRNRENRTAFHMPRTCMTRFMVTVRAFVNGARNSFFAHAEKFALVVLYLIGMYKVNLFHLIYLLQFLLFFAQPKLARRAWHLLVAYSAFVLLCLYFWSVYMSYTGHTRENSSGESNEDDTEGGGWTEKIGLFQAENFWTDLLFYYLTFFFVAAQLYVFHRKDQLHLGETTPKYSTLSQNLTLISCYASLLIFGLIPAVSLIKLGYIVVFLASMLVHQFAKDSRNALAAFWYLVVAFTGIALFAIYAYQFDVIYHVVKSIYPDEGLLYLFSLKDIGLTRSGFHGSTLVQTLGPSIVFAMCVFQFRSVRSSISSSNTLSRTSSSSIIFSATSSPELLTSAPSLRTHQQEHKGNVPSRSPNMSQLSPAERNRLLRESNLPFIRRHIYLQDEIELPYWLEWVFRWLVDVLFHHSMKITVIITWVVVVSINYEDALNLIYLIIATLFLPFSISKIMWAPLSLYACVVIVSRYMFQFESFDNLETDTTKWIGFSNFHGHLFGHLIGDFMILIFSTIQCLSNREYKLVQAAKVEYDKRVKQARWEREEEERRKRRRKAEKEAKRQLILDEKNAPADGSKPIPQSRRSSRMEDGSLWKESIVYLDSKHQSVDTSIHQQSGSIFDPSLPYDKTAARPRIRQQLLKAAKAENAKDFNSSKEASEENNPPTLYYGVFFKALIVDLITRRLCRMVEPSFKHLGLQLALGALLITAFYRHNVLSILYIFAFIGVYIFAGHATIFRMWHLLVLALIISLIYQYIILIGESPFEAERYDWEALSIQDQRWWLLGGFTSGDLYPDFFAFFFCALHLHYRVNILSKEHLAWERSRNRKHTPPNTPFDLAYSDRGSHRSPSSTSSTRKRGIRGRVGNMVDGLMDGLADSISGACSGDTRIKSQRNYRSNMAPVPVDTTLDAYQLNDALLLESTVGSPYGDDSNSTFYRSSSLEDNDDQRTIEDVGHRIGAILTDGSEKAAFTDTPPPPPPAPPLPVAPDDRSNGDATRIDIFDNSNTDGKLNATSDEKLFTSLSALDDSNQGLELDTSSEDEEHDEDHDPELDIILQRINMYTPQVARSHLLKQSKRDRKNIEYSEKKGVEMWSLVWFVLFMIMDKMLFLFVFYVGTYHCSLLRIGYFILSMYVLLSADAYQGNLESVKRRLHTLHKYNLFVLICFTLYQTPYFSEARSESISGVHWHHLIGVYKYDDVYSDEDQIGGLDANGALHPILIFLLVEILLIVFDTNSYDAVQEFFAHDREQAPYRGRHSAVLRAHRRNAALAHINESRTYLQRFFDTLFKTIISQDVTLFKDRIVWPQRRPKDWDDKHSDDGGLYTPSSKLLANSTDRGLGDADWSHCNDNVPIAQTPTTESTVNAKTKEANTSHKEESENHKETSGLAREQAQLHMNDLYSKEHELPTIQTIDTLDIVFNAKDNTQRTKAVVAWMERAHQAIREWLLAFINPVLWTEYTRTDTADGINSAAHVKVIASTPEDYHCHTLWILYKVVCSNSVWICYTAFLCNLLWSGTVISMVLPMVTFLYAIVVSPRPPKAFWLFCLAYLTFSMIVKFLFQLPIFCVTTKNEYTFAPNPFCESALQQTKADEFKADHMLGLFKTLHGDYVHIIAWDMVCVLLIIWHRYMLACQGLWDYSEEDIGDRFLSYQAANRQIDRTAAQKRRFDVVSKLRASQPSQYQADNAIDNIYHESKDEYYHPSDDDAADDDEDEYEQEEILAQANSLESYCFWWGNGADRGLLPKLELVLPGEILDYLYNIMPRHGNFINQVKPGRDYYMVMFVAELLSAAYIVFLYPKMASTSNDTVVNSLSSNLFSGSMVLCFFTQIMIIILDRIIYLYRSLGWKLVLQVCTLVYWFSLILFAWPQSSQTGFTSSRYLQVFFLLKAAYFISSALQLRWGFTPVECTGFGLTERASIWRGYVFTAYRALPFVFELKSILDWMCTDSSLDLWDSFKLEDIYATLFLVQCDIYYRKSKHRGESQPTSRKMLTGCCSFLILLFILLGPLLLFSSANPVVSSNNVLSASLSVDILGPSGEYNFLTISSVFSKQEVTDEEFMAMKEERLIDENDKQEHIQRMEMVTFADENWAISRPSLQILEENLQNPDTNNLIRFSYEFSRPAPVASKVIGGSLQNPLSLKHKEQLAAMLNGTRTAPVHLSSLIPAYFRLPATGDPQELRPQNRTGALLVLVSDYQHYDAREPPPFGGVEGAKWWELAQLSPSKQKRRDRDGGNAQADSQRGVKEKISFYTISNPVWESALGGAHYSIIAVYLSVVLVVHQFVRLTTAQLHQKIMFQDLHDVNHLVDFCKGIFIARRNKELRKEETLYRRLVTIYRHPEMLARLTERVDRQEHPDYESSNEEEDKEAEIFDHNEADQQTINECTVLQKDDTINDQGTYPVDNDSKSSNQRLRRRR